MLRDAPAWYRSRMRVAASAEAGPFRFDGDRRGLLLVHGFTGTPFEVRPLGEALHARGFSVVGPRLAGHGGTVADLGATRWPEWYDTVERAFDELRARTDGVGVCGLSLGGLLTLELARRRPRDVQAIAVLSVPLWLPRWMAGAIRVAGRVAWARAQHLPKWGGSDIADREMRARNPTGRGFTVAALNSLLDCMAHVRGGLGEIDRPAFVAHGHRDGTAPFDCMAEIARKLRGPVEQLVLPRSRHVITLDVERADLFRRLGDFFSRQLEIAK